MKVLIIDNTREPESFGSPELCRLLRTLEGHTIYVRRAPEGDLPSSPRQFDRIIASGSVTSCLDSAPWIEKLLQFIRAAVEEKVPYLGVCFGHQMLIRALGGLSYLRKSSTPEFGWTEIDVTGDSPLFQGLPSRFYSYSSHFEESSSLPAKFRNLAKSDRCQIQACQVENHPVFGIQFHPEKSATEGEASLLQKKKKNFPIPLLNAGKGNQLYNSKVGETLVRNFIAL